ncbi:MAG: hypothetical protein CVU95_06320 [Firmicutes bacterium HGW-Firmicutes-2]|jgi:hypothetical protein|nr:MAG: hypothetical protein CVU95_06320 [Firmicutes bacterium HGW-Firmicutes-2]
MKINKDTEIYGQTATLIGSIGLLSWLIPLFGVLVNTLAIGLGVYAAEEDRDGLAWVGIIFGGMGLFLTILRSGLVYYYG